MREKVLIVDDDEMNRNLLREILKYQGYVVIVAADGTQGLEEAREHLPALILLDIYMPDVDGFATIATLRRDPATAGIKVIAYTAGDLKGNWDKFSKAGFDGYISKPVDIGALFGQIRECLNNRALP